MKLILGSHVSFRAINQLLGSIETAVSYGSNALMIYTGAPQNTKRSKIDEDLVKQAHQLMKKNNIKPENVIVHAPYLINLANNAGDNNKFAISFLKSEITRVGQLGLKYLVLHPGSFVNLTIEEGIQNTINALNQVLNNDNDVMILLETMAGKGSEIGHSFEQIKAIIDEIEYPDKIGVCLDTCHTNDAGYDWSDPDQVLAEFDQVIGLNKLKCVHLNDSKNEVGMRKDRHANIGYGTIGFENILKIVYHPLLENIPKILETPYFGKFPPYKQEIEMIKAKAFNPNLESDIQKYYEK